MITIASEELRPGYACGSVFEEGYFRGEPGHLDAHLMAHDFSEIRRDVPVSICRCQKSPHNAGSFLRARFIEEARALGHRLEKTMARYIVVLDDALPQFLEAETSLFQI